jgi:hypothetical protein
MWTHKHSSSWQDLPVDDDSGDDVAPRGPGGSGYGGRDASSDSESTALLQRPQHHVTLTVSRQGEGGASVCSAQAAATGAHAGLHVDLCAAGDVLHAGVEM